MLGRHDFPIARPEACTQDTSAGLGVALKTDNPMTGEITEINDDGTVNLGRR